MTESETTNPYAAPTASIDVPTERARRISLATRVERFVGRFLDNILGGVMVVAAGLAAASMGLVTLDTESGELDMVSTLIFALPGFVLYIAVQGYLLATRSQSIGKILMKTRIDKVDGTGPAGPLATIGLREVLVVLIGFIPFVGSLFGLVDALFIFRADHRCIHDLIAGTVVHKVPRELKRR